MTRVYTVHNQHNEIDFLTVDSAVRAIFHHKVQSRDHNARIHLTSRVVSDEQAALAADFWE